MKLKFHIIIITIIVVLQTRTPAHLCIRVLATATKPILLMLQSCLCNSPLPQDLCTGCFALKGSFCGLCQFGGIWTDVPCQSLHGLPDLKLPAHPMLGSRAGAGITLDGQHRIVLV